MGRITPSIVKPLGVRTLVGAVRILIVDDHPTNRKLLRAMLEAERFEVAEAADGVEALKALRSSVVDAVISDILMPNMDGYSLCRAVRADCGLKNLPFLIYTSTYVSPGDENLAEKCGADGYIRKPAPAEKIIKAVRALIAKKAKRRRAAAPASEKEVLRKYSELLVHKLEERNTLLEASEEKFRQLVENLEQVFFLEDAGDGAMFYVSPSFEKVWGLKTEALYNEPRRWLDSVVAEDKAAVEKSLAAAPDGQACEFRVALPNKALRWIRARRFPIRNDKGALSRIGWIAEDITGLKSAEDQLRQAQKIESVGRLAGGVAHDFNNVLTAISGYTQFLMSTFPSSDPRLNDAREIEKAVARAAALTGQLLAFSRKQVLKPKILSLNESLAGIEMMIRRLLGEDIRIEIKREPALGRCKADPGQIDQLILNLAVNARDAMPKGGLLKFETSNVELDGDALLHPDSRPGPYVRLSISDTGCGMSPEVLSHIFEPFFTTKPADKGTGLGLSTVHGIVRQSGGRIDVRSTPGSGTRFDIHLPRVDAASDQAAPAALKPAKTGAETVLLIEDDNSVRPVTRRILAGLGYTVLEARDGLEALTLAEKHRGPIDLALIDMIMPGASGPEVIAGLSERHPKLRVICMSGYTEHAALKQAGGAALFIQKPFTRESLADKIREALG